MQHGRKLEFLWTLLDQAAIIYLQSSVGISQHGMLATIVAVHLLTFVQIIRRVLIIQRWTHVSPIS